MFNKFRVYPLLQDNTSWFWWLFDKQKLDIRSHQFLKRLQRAKHSCLFERSRSGNGGHVWSFLIGFTPQSEAEKIFISILEQSGAFSTFDKKVPVSIDCFQIRFSFFSGKGLGNLIACHFSNLQWKRE